MIKVLIVDDSPLIRGLLKEILEQASDMKVVGCAEDPFQAREMIKSLNPDVLTLDVEMPKMNGIQFLKNLMRLRPMPVVMISTLTQQGAPVTLEALEIGAVDFVAKPTQKVVSELSKYAELIHEKVRTAASAKVRGYKPVKSDEAITKGSFKASHLVAIGASTGGTEAIKEVLIRLPANFPPVVITQHIPPVFSTSFAMRMDRISNMRVKEAADGDKVLPGHVYIAPGDAHLKIDKRGSELVCRLEKSEPVNRHMPSVDVLFNSVAKHCPKQCTAVLLTGMGADGARGLLQLREAGAYTLAQDEATSVVWGMPKAAVDIGGAMEQVSLAKVARRLCELAAK